MAATAYFNKFSSYCRMVAHAKSLAKRSVLVDHCGLEHIDLTSECDNVERVYAIDKETKRGISKLSLIEFKSDEDADRLMRHAQHNEGLLPVPLKILRYNGRSNARLPDRTQLPYPMERVRLSCDRELSPSFANYTDLVANNLMSLVALKLRFVTLVNFERILCSGMFGEYELMPFGSSVIDMGCDSGDLDLIITRKDNHYQAIKNAASQFSQRHPRQTTLAADLAAKLEPQSDFKPAPSSNLVHLDKSLYSETKDNSGFRGTMRWFDHVLREYMPLTDGFGVLTLHRAKVPIIKFTSRITNIECDLSFDLGLEHRNVDGLAPVNSGILMTEILYTLCRQNNLITAFVIYLRIFAKLNGITSKTPGVGMTNFQLLSLIIFFLQRASITETTTANRSRNTPYPTSQTTNREEDLLALDYDTEDELINKHQDENIQFTVDTLQPMSPAPKSRATARSERVKNSNELPLVPPFRQMVDGSFLDGASAHPERVHFSDEQLNQVLPLVIAKFFDFYSNFDFSSSCLNLYDARIDKKLDNSTIYVLNPIDTSRNICHNVNRKALDTFVKQVREVSRSLKSSRGNACPLAMIKGLMLKHQRQTKNNRTLSLNLEDLQDSQPFTPEGIAQDVCR